MINQDGFHIWWQTKLLYYIRQKEKQQDKTRQTKGKQFDRVKDQGGESETEGESRSQVEEEEGGCEKERGAERQALPFLVVKAAERTSRNSLCCRRAEI